MVRRILLAAACIVPALAGAQSLYPGQFEDKRVVKDAVETEIRCFDLSDVRLLPGRFHDNMLRDSAWLASIGTDRLLHSFRTTAGVFSGKEGGYMTVKKEEVYGHIDHTLLKAFSTTEQIEAIAEEALKYGTASICIPASFVNYIHNKYKDVNVTLSPTRGLTTFYANKGGIIVSFR